MPAKAVPGIPLGWQQFVVSLVFIVIVPLAVLGMDLSIKSEIPDQDLFLTLGLYTVATGASSCSIALLAVSIVMTGAYLVAYGVTAAHASGCPEAFKPPSITGYLVRYGPALIFTIICGLERYNRHVVGGELFWDFK
jgi:hypothetical protein